MNARASSEKICLSQKSDGSEVQKNESLYLHRWKWENACTGNIKWNIKMFDWIKFSYILWSELFRKLCFQSVCCFFQFAFIFLILTCFITHTPDWNLQMEVNCKITFQKLYSLIKYIYLLLHCMYMYLVYLTFQTMNPKPELGVQHKQIQLININKETFLIVIVKMIMLVSRDFF